MQKEEKEKKVCQHCCPHDDVRIHGDNMVECERCGKRWYATEKCTCPSIYPTCPTWTVTPNEPWTWHSTPSIFGEDGNSSGGGSMTWSKESDSSIVSTNGDVESINKKE